jgi:hypothetical protein
MGRGRPVNGRPRRQFAQQERLVSAGLISPGSSAASPLPVSVTCMQRPYEVAPRAPSGKPTGGPTGSTGGKLPVGI